MGSAAIRPSVAVSRLLRARRKELRLTLREVSERMALRGERLPPSTLARVEQGKLDPGVRRLLLLLKLYELPSHVVADLVELEELAVEEPTGKDLETLHRQGVEYWKKGNIPQALAHMFAIRVHDPQDRDSRLLRQKATLAFAIVTRELGKLRLARELINDLLCEPPEPELTARVLIQASTVWLEIGSTEMALALVRQAATHLRADDHEHRAWVDHQEAMLLLRRGEPELARAAVNRAIAQYRKRRDTSGEARALIVSVGIKESLGDVKGALACAHKAVTLADRHGHELALVSGRLEMGRLLVASGSPEKGLETLREAQAQAVILEDRIAEFHAHYYLWKAYGILDDRDRMRFEFQAASYFLEFIDVSSPEAKEIQRLQRAGTSKAESRKIPRSP